jgi:hypothetical protein
MTVAVVEAERREWRQHPVTQEFLASLKASKQEAMEMWAGEKFVGETAELTLAANTAALGGMRLLNQVIDQIEAMGEEE